MNMKAIDGALERLIKIEIPKEKWLNLPDVEEPDSTDPFYLKVQKPCLQWKGDLLPVSTFTPGGMMTTMGTTRIEKRKICAKAPTWKPEKCS